MQITFQRFKTVIYVFLVGFLLSACEEPDTTTSSKIQEQKSEKVKIGFVMKTLTNPFFISMEQGARKAEKELDVELIVKTAAEETSIYQQIDIVNQLASRKDIKAIVIAPGDSVELVPVLKAAQDKGIKIVNIDNQLDPSFSEKIGLNGVPFISVDNEAAAFLSAQYISRNITQPTKVAILEGIPTAANAQARKAGAIRAFTQNPNITIAASQTAHWKIDEAYEVIKNIFAENHDIGAIFCANDMMAMGVLKYLKETGRDIPVAAFDAIDTAKDAIRAGGLDVSIDQLPAEQGYIGIKTALDMINGKAVEEQIFINVRVIDKAALN